MGVLPNLSIPSQGTRQNLCWAAVTVGICDYLDHSQLTLQGVTSNCLPFCNGDLTSNFCDVPWQLQDALNQYSHPAQPKGRALSLDEIVDQIANRQRPIGMMISFPDNVNHYCLIKGFVEVNGKMEVVILDPAQSDPRDTPFPLESLLSNAALGAPWTDSCLIT
jgi:hypothetical protein